MDELKEQVRELLAARGGQPTGLGELLNALGLGPSHRKRLRRLMREMAAEGGVSQLRGRQYSLSAKVKSITGILRVSPKGFGFVAPVADRAASPGRRDVFVPRKRMGDAMHNDRVRVRLLGETSRSPEGEVIEVLERGTREIVGSFYHTRHGGQVIPRNDRFTRTVVTPRPEPALHLENGTYVVAAITGWTEGAQPLIGRVVEKLGEANTPGIDVTMLVRDAGVPRYFSDGTMREVEAMPAAVGAAELARRLDLRATTTFTMDGAGAKDFDDALSIERVAEDRWRLGVHIADVAHHVGEGGALDADAYERGTSIYPVDRVVPMLPDRLSNDLCSLRPGEDRLTLSCIMEIDLHGRVHHYEIVESVIRSSHRLVYEDVQALMDGKAAPPVVRAIGGLRTELGQLYELRRVLTDMRMRRGALDLDIPETEVQLNADGTVRALERRERLESHRVVEECMLIANEVVAVHLFNLHVPTIYRVHEPPDLDKLRRLVPVLEHLGVRFPSRRSMSAHGIQSALVMAERTETGFIARRLILQSMMRACYLDENRGHFGLGSACYTHFTSPIRRYPDLIIHRLLKESITAGTARGGAYSPPHLGLVSGAVVPPALRAAGCLPAHRTEYLRGRMGEWATHCSDRERRAEEIEKEAEGVKAMEYMRGFLGQEFEGYVTGVTSFGFFVELADIPVEGLVHVRSLDDDFYEFDDEHLLLVGRERGSTIKLGDRMRVAVQNANAATRELDLVITQRENTRGDDTRRGWEHRERRKAEARHRERQPRRGGFQARGGKRGHG